MAKTPEGICTECGREESYVGHTRYAIDAHPFTPAAPAPIAAKCETCQHEPHTTWCLVPGCNCKRMLHCHICGVYHAFQLKHDAPIAAQTPYLTKCVKEGPDCDCVNVCKHKPVLAQGLNTFGPNHKVSAEHKLAPIAAQTEKVSECSHCGRPIEFVDGGWRHYSSAKTDCFLSATPTKMVPLPAPKSYYKCFGCKAVFVTDEDAEKHFGKPKERELPICAAEQVDAARDEEWLKVCCIDAEICLHDGGAVIRCPHGQATIGKLPRSASLKQETQTPKCKCKTSNFPPLPGGCLTCGGAASSSPLETPAPEMHYAIKGNGTYQICEPITPAPADTGATNWHKPGCPRFSGVGECDCR